MATTLEAQLLVPVVAVRHKEEGTKDSVKRVKGGVKMVTSMSKHLAKKPSIGGF